MDILQSAEDAMYEVHHEAYTLIIPSVPPAYLPLLTAEVAWYDHLCLVVILDTIDWAVSPR